MVKYFVCLLICSLAHASEDCSLALLGVSQPGIRYASGFTAPSPKTVEALIAPAHAEPEALKGELLSYSTAQLVAWLHSNSYRELLVQKFSEANAVGTLTKSASNDAAEIEAAMAFAVRLLVRSPDAEVLKYFSELRIVDANLKNTSGNFRTAFTLQLKLAAMTLAVPLLHTEQPDAMTQLASFGEMSPNLLTPLRVAELDAAITEFYFDDVRVLSSAIRVFLISEMLHYALIDSRPFNDVGLGYIARLVDFLPTDLELTSVYADSLMRTSAKMTIEAALKRNLNLGEGRNEKLIHILQKLKRSIVI